MPPAAACNAVTLCRPAARMRRPRSRTFRSRSSPVSCAPIRSWSVTSRRARPSNGPPSRVCPSDGPPSWRTAPMASMASRTASAPARNRSAISALSVPGHGSATASSGCSIGVAQAWPMTASSYSRAWSPAKNPSGSGGSVSSSGTVIGRCTASARVCRASNSSCQKTEALCALLAADLRRGSRLRSRYAQYDSMTSCLARVNAT